MKKQNKNNQEKDIERLRKKMQKHAKSAKIKLNPNKKIVDAVLLGILKKKEKFEEGYCPCRIPTGNKEKDEEIICPCIFHQDEIVSQGHCKCNLFVK